MFPKTHRRFDLFHTEILVTKMKNLHKFHLQRIISEPGPHSDEALSNEESCSRCTGKHHHIKSTLLEIKFTLQNGCPLKGLSSGIMNSCIYICILIYIYIQYTGICSRFRVTYICFFGGHIQQPLWCLKPTKRKQADIPSLLHHLFVWHPEGPLKRFWNLPFKTSIGKAPSFSDLKFTDIKGQSRVALPKTNGWIPKMMGLGKGNGTLKK